jgi:hypothetical protein
MAAEKPAEEKPAEENPVEAATSEEEAAEESARNGNGASEPPKDAEAAARLAFKLRRKAQRQDQPPASS